jgi:AAA ATPase-like protein/effector-associated domain 1 (EAD1)-containing protein
VSALPSQQSVDLQEALSSAFTTAELARFTDNRLALNLETIDGSNLSEKVYHLLKWAEARGRTTELIEAAVRERPGNRFVVAAAENARAHLESIASACALRMERQARRGDVAQALQTFERLRLLLRELGTTPSSDVLELRKRLLRSTPGDLSGTAWVPLPRIGAAPDGRFVGRAAELARLCQRSAQAGADRWPIVFLTGEAGVGKTALAGRFADQVHEHGATVLYGRCDEEPIDPYQPFVEALRQRVRHVGWDNAEDLEPLGALLPELRQRLGEPPAVPADLQRHLVFDCVARALAAWADPHLLLLVLDDMHWSDKPTAKLLRYLARNAGPERLMILATYRRETREEPDCLADLLLELRKDNRLELLNLHGLDEDETEALVETLLDKPVEPAVVRTLYRRTDGNPFFISEAAYSLRDEPAAPVPKGVHELILRSLVKVSDATREALSAAATIGREFDVGVLAEVLGVDTSEALKAVDEAPTGLLDELPDRNQYTFSHAIVRDAIYERLSASRRAWWHERVGAALEARGAPRHPAALAYHFSLAGSDRWIDYALAAGREASRALAYEEAERHLEHAVEGLRALGPNHERRRCQALLDLARLLRRTGEAERARTCFEDVAASARERDDAEQLARAALGVGERYWQANVVDQGYRDLLSEALQKLSTEPSPLRARLMSRLAENLAFTPARERSDQLSADAVAMARRLKDDVDVLIVALTARHVTLLYIDHVEERLALIEEVLELRGARRELWAEAQQWRLYDLCELGRFDEARVQHAELLEVAGQLRQPFFRHVALHWKGVLADLEGDVEETERLAEESLALGRQAQSFDALSTSVAKLYMLRRRQGRLEELFEDIRSLAAMPIAPASWQAALALACLVTGRREEGTARAGALIDDLSAIPRDFFWLSAVAVLADCAALCRDAARGERLYDALRGYASRFVQISFAASLGSVERFLGLLAATVGETRWVDAEGHFRRALEENQRIGAPVLTAVTQCDYGEFLLARGGPADIAAAADLGAAAHDVADRLGLQALGERAAGLQRSPGPGVG